jgi:hypothetical protein
MTRKPTPSRLASILALIAVGLLAVAIAGPATAHDHRGFDDDDPAGTISSFDPASGQLVIDLSDGGSVAGIVTRRTWIKSDRDESCDDERRGRLLHDWCRNGAKASSGGEHGWSHGHGRGDTDDLVAGAVVEDAILVLVDGKAIFAKVDLDD